MSAAQVGLGLFLGLWLFGVPGVIWGFCIADRAERASRVRAVERCHLRESKLHAANAALEARVTELQEFLAVVTPENWEDAA